MTIGKQFKVARILNNWTILDLSIMTLRRISPSKISLFERGLVDLSKIEIALLQRVLCVERCKSMLQSSWSREKHEDNE